MSKAWIGLFLFAWFLLPASAQINNGSSGGGLPSGCTGATGSITCSNFIATGGFTVSGNPAPDSSSAIVDPLVIATASLPGSPAVGQNLIVTNAVSGGTVFTATGCPQTSGDTTGSTATICQWNGTNWINLGPALGAEWLSTSSPFSSVAPGFKFYNGSIQSLVGSSTEVNGGSALASPVNLTNGVGTSASNPSGSNVQIDQNPLDPAYYGWSYEFDGGPFTSGGIIGGRFALNGSGTICTTLAGIPGPSNTGAMSATCAATTNLEITQASASGTVDDALGNVSTYGNWELDWTVALPALDTANTRLFLGAGSTLNGLANQSGFGLRYDPVSNGDTLLAAKFYCIKATVFVTAPAVTLTAGHTYTYRAFSTTAGTIQMQVYDNGTPGTVNTSVCSTGSSNIPIVNLSVEAFFAQNTGAGASAEADFDFVAFKRTGVTGRP